MENLWQAVIAFQEYPFKTATGLPFRYKLKVGKNGEYNRELLIDCREKSKSLAWSSMVLAFENSMKISEEVKKPKALGDIIRQEQVRLLKEIPSEENLWQAVIAFQDYPFKTATGLPFQYKLKVGKNGEYNRELLINRREKSKSLAWSSVVLAFENSKRISEEVKKPKALGDIRGVSYIYPILWRFGLIRVPEAIEKKMGKQR